MSTGKRIALLALHLESNRFAPPVSRADFEEKVLLYGDEIMQDAAQEHPRMVGTMTGFIHAMNEAGPGAGLVHRMDESGHRTDHARVFLRRVLHDFIAVQQDFLFEVGAADRRRETVAFEMQRQEGDAFASAHSPAPRFA